MAYKQIDEKWGLLGYVGNANCRGVREALTNGNFELATPQFKELQVAGQRLLLLPACR